MPRPTPPLTFDPQDIVNRQALIEEVEALASRVKDKPGLPARTLLEKQRDCMIGLVPERYLLEQEGFRKGGRYQDVVGEGFEEPWLNGRLEIKTVRRRTLQAAQQARLYSGGGAYDHMLVFYCDRDTMTYEPLVVFDKKGRVIRQW
jgi:hypothetical protein